MRDPVALVIGREWRETSMENNNRSGNSWISRPTRLVERDLSVFSCCWSRAGSQSPLRQSPPVCLGARRDRRMRTRASCRHRRYISLPPMPLFVRWLEPGGGQLDNEVCGNTNFNGPQLSPSGRPEGTGCVDAIEACWKTCACSFSCRR